VKDKIKTCLIYLMNAIQAAKLYREEHPKFTEFVESLYAKIVEILEERKELTVGIVTGELAWEDEIFFNLSKRLEPLIKFLEESRIARIVFQQGLRLDELSHFIIFLARTKNLDKVDEQEYFTLHGIQNIRAGRLRAQVKAEDVDVAAELRTKYDSSVQVAAHSLNMVLEEEDIDYLDLRFNILSIMEDFMGRHQELLNLISVKDRDLATFVHLLNVSLLSMFFASRLEFSKDDVLDLGIAALYHDVGKLYISLKIIKKKTKLAEREFIQIRDHPVLGARILEGYKETLGTLPIVAAFEHHMRHDRTGYPKVAYARKPHLAAMMISICDVYDALALKRCYKKDYPPDKIHELMVMEKGRMFEPELLDKFFRHLGVWPVGSIVALNDGRVGVVRENHEQDVRRPVVEILSPGNGQNGQNGGANGGETVDLLSDRNLVITEALNPHDRGREYLALVKPLPLSA
jgi:HD-GYP domain-containing protein (c-di-GMP phosphodiesterase class II)